MKNGQFSVKAAYKFLKGRDDHLQSNTSINNQDVQVWNKLWKIKTIPRHTHLAWRMLHNRLPVKECLVKRGVDFIPLCSFCDQHRETLDHLFMYCEWSRSYWFCSQLGISHQNFGSDSCNFIPWLEKVLMHEDAETTRLVLSLCYVLWNVRNKRCFEGLELPDPVTCANQANKNVIIFNQSNALNLQQQILPIPSPQSNIRWTLPPAGWYELNVDAAGPTPDGVWGLAAVIRDADGVIAAASCCQKQLFPNSDIAELMALKHGLKFARDMIFLNLIAEADSLNAIESITVKKINSPYRGHCC